MGSANGIGEMSPALDAALSLSITASDLEQSIHFYTEGLGFDLSEQHEADGVVRFVRLRAGSASLGLGQDDFAKGSNRVKGVGLRIWFETDQDVRVIAERALAAGLMLDSGPEALPWGPMAFSITDPDGFAITIVNPSS